MHGDGMGPGTISALRVWKSSDIDHGSRHAQMARGKEGSTGTIASVGIEPVEIGPSGDLQTRERKRDGRQIVSTTCSDRDQHGNTVHPDLMIGS